MDPQKFNWNEFAKRQQFIEDDFQSLTEELKTCLSYPETATFETISDEFVIVEAPIQVKANLDLPVTFDVSGHLESLCTEQVETKGKGVTIDIEPGQKK